MSNRHFSARKITENPILTVSFIKKGDVLGDPLTRSALDCAFEKLVRAAEVKVITMHGLRHCTATWMLGEHEAIHVVSARLGHSSPNVTLSAYSHALPSQQAEAAARHGRLLFGHGR